MRPIGSNGEMRPIGSNGAASPKITPRQNQVLRLMDDGLSYKEIALRLGISAETVHKHLSNAYAALGADGYRDAALRLGWHNRTREYPSNATTRTVSA